MCEPEGMQPEEAEQTNKEEINEEASAEHHRQAKLQLIEPATAGENRLKKFRAENLIAEKSVFDPAAGGEQVRRTKLVSFIPSNKVEVDFSTFVIF